MRYDDSDLGRLKESLADELFGKEPLARAILSYLSKDNRLIYNRILDEFETIVSAMVDTKIANQRGEDKAGEVT